MLAAGAEDEDENADEQSGGRAYVLNAHGSGATAFPLEGWRRVVVVTDSAYVSGGGRGTGSRSSIAICGRC